MSNRIEEIQLSTDTIKREKTELITCYNDEMKELKDFNVESKTLLRVVRATTSEIEELKSKVVESLKEVERNYLKISNKITDIYLNEVVNNKNVENLSVQVLSMFIDLFHGIFYRPNELSSVKDRRGKYHLDSNSYIILRKDYYTWNECLDLLLCREHNIRSFKLILINDFRIKLENCEIIEENINRSQEKYNKINELYEPKQMKKENLCIYLLYEWYINAIDHYNKHNALKEIRKRIIEKEEYYRKITSQYNDFIVNQKK